jgi:hypothetical protein
MRGQTIWEIWFGRDKQLFDHITTTREGVIMKVWTQVRQYLVLGWEKFREKIQRGKLTKDKACFLFTKEYGDNECLCSLLNDELQVLFEPFGIV